jgi:hypothetical protein
MGQREERRSAADIASLFLGNQQSSLIRFSYHEFHKTSKYGVPCRPKNIGIEFHKRMEVDKFNVVALNTFLLPSVYKKLMLERI